MFSFSKKQNNLMTKSESSYVKGISFGKKQNSQNKFKKWHKFVPKEKV